MRGQNFVPNIRDSDDLQAYRRRPTTSEDLRLIMTGAEFNQTVLLFMTKM